MSTSRLSGGCSGETVHYNDDDDDHDQDGDEDGVEDEDDDQDGESSIRERHCWIQKSLSPHECECILNNDDAKGGANCNVSPCKMTLELEPNEMRCAKYLGTFSFKFESNNYFSESPLPLPSRL